ncbi:hypothetical protein JXJ21_01885 [candidate division KSB1 bacterium]|nr:hypothetical protein [candidate division KSB1 bacterium]
MTRKKDSLEKSSDTEFQYIVQNYGCFFFSNWCPPITINANLAGINLQIQSASCFLHFKKKVDFNLF